MNQKPSYEEALAIIKLNPLPEDAREQIDRLYKEASEDEKTFFSMIYEGLFLEENMLSKK